MAIPKKIHWCWLSGDPLPGNIAECVKSWKRIMPNYEFVLWDMNRFDIHSVKFVADACNARKWAFAADYIRCYALFTEGGIYLDADVMVYRRLDALLNCRAFSGVIGYTMSIRLSNNELLDLDWFLEAEMIGSEKHHPFFRACMDYYETKVFQMDAAGEVVCDIMPGVFTRVAYEQFSLNLNASTKQIQELDMGIVIYPPTVLGVLWSAVNMKTYAVHLCMDSWRTVKYKSALQKLYANFCAKYRFIAMLHIWRKKIWKKIKK